MNRTVANAEARIGARQQSKQPARRASLRAGMWLAVCFLLGTPETIFAQVFAGRTARVIEQNTQGTNYFSIMGHVQFAQAYELPTRSPSLIDFINFAGGLKASASSGGQIRIIRNGKVAQQSFYNPNSTIKLMPGDLVVIDGKVGGGTIVRGGQSNEESAKKVQLGLVGVLDYPVIMEVNSELATVGWVTRQLGQLPEVATAAAAKSIAPRRFGAITEDQLLTDGTVIVFDQHTIDKTRLPDLPRPFKAGKDKHPEVGAASPPAAVATQPRNQASPGSAAPLQPLATRPVLPQRSNPNVPGHSPVADEPPLANPDEERAVKELLTDPRSVPLDTERYVPSGTAQVREPGRVRVQTDATEIAKPDPSANRPQPATKPFESYPTGETNSVQQPGSGRTEGETSAADRENSLDLTPVVEPQPAGQDSVSNAEKRDPNPRTQSEGLPITNEPRDGSLSGTETAKSDGTSFAARGADGFSETTKQSAQPAASKNADNGSDSSLPRKQIGLTGPITVEPIEPRNISPNVVTGDAPAIQVADGKNDNQASAASSQLLQKPETPANVPVIIITSIGGLGLFVAICMLISMAGPSREPDPRSVANAAGKDDRYLDRLINNEMEIVEAAPSRASVVQLFGTPTPEPMLRIDNAHTSVRRPHFLNRGDQRGVGGRRSGPPEMPNPDSVDPDIVQPGVAPLRPRRPIQTPTRSPMTPARPAAASASASALEELVSTAATIERRNTRNVEASNPDDASSGSQLQQTAAATTQRVPTSKRTFRIDSGHETPQPAMAKQPKAVSVQPAPVLAQGSDILDRVLAAVQKGQQ